MPGRIAGIGSALLAVLVLAVAAHAEGTAPAGPADFDGYVTLPSGSRMWLECRGSGSPTVILEPGLRNRGDSWDYSLAGGQGTGVFAKAAGLTRTCIYDRPGTVLGQNQRSRSTPARMPRTTGEVVADLHDLLGAAGLPGPYVIVGASTGGLVGREYTSRYPDEVAGLVEVDAINEAVESFMKPRQFAIYDLFYLQTPSPDLADYADLERIDFDASFAEMRISPRPPRSIPLVVLSKTKGFGTPSGVSRGFGRMVNRAWKQAQNYLARLDPNSIHVFARGSGHAIHLHRPGLVAHMTARVLGAARTGKSLVPKRKRRSKIRSRP